MVLKEYTLVLCTYVIDEAKEVIRRKFPSYIDKFQSFLNSRTYKLVYTPRGMDFDSKLMRDPKDVPILVTAEREDVDCFLTGDKDFLSLEAVKHLDSSLNYPVISGTVILLTTLYGRFVFKEKNGIFTYIGIGVTLASTILFLF